MNFYVLTLFPDMIKQGLNTSIIGRAMEQGHITLNAINIREFTENKHKHVDDYPYGGGAGMVMQAEPVYKAYEYAANQIEQNLEETLKEAQALTQKASPRVIYVTPQGKVFNQKMAEEFSKEENLMILCGHYEGIDERVLKSIVTDHVSIGDYVLTGGELPAMVMIDSIARLIPGVLNNDVSSEFESFQDGLLEYPQYTRPEEFMGQKVPEVLLSGHHAKIEEWRRQQSLQRTLERRPDLLETAVLSEKDKKYLKSIRKEK